ncbi:MAG: co-chaperone GroES [Clostridia bacterium]|jgi:chaperonin GroES
MKLTPLFDKIVLSAVENAEKTQGGIVLPSSAQEKPQLGKVEAIGPGGIIDGKKIEMQVAIGDVVLYSKYAGSEFKLDGKNYIILKQSDVLAIVKESK